MIHNGIVMTAHNTRFLPLSPGTLAVAAVNIHSGCFVVSEVGSFHLATARDVAATGAAIALSAITTAADVEILTAFRKPANQLNQNNFDVFTHTPPEGGTGQTPRFMSALYRSGERTKPHFLRGSIGH